MHEEILRRLSVITDEEQRILDGDPEIDRSLYMEGGKVHIHEDDCIFCMKCYGPCPAVNFAPAAKTEEKGFED